MQSRAEHGTYTATLHSFTLLATYSMVSRSSA